MYADLEGALLATNVVVALATLALAFVTWQLARQTKRSVDETSKQASISAEALKVARRHADIASEEARAALQPMLVACPVDESGNERISIGSQNFERTIGSVLVERLDTDWLVSVPLRNVGPGVAVIDSLGLVVDDKTGGWAGSMEYPILATMERARFNFVIPNDQAEAEFVRTQLASGTIDLIVGYTDVAGNRFLTRVCLSRMGPKAVVWISRQTMLYGQGQVDPFATSGPAGIRDFQVRHV